MNVATPDAVRPARAARLLLALLLAATSLVATATTADAAAPKRAVVGPTPVPGSVVTSGMVTIASFISTSAGIQDAEVQLDGVVVPVDRTTDSPTYQRLSTTVEVADGLHVVHVRVVEPDGQAFTRMWRFSATSTQVRRLAGDSRITTSVVISRDTYPPGTKATAAVLARADDFADALAAAPLAAKVDAPLLLTDREELSTATAQELQRVLPAGATVHLLGGLGAVSAQVEADVQALGFTTRRHAGNDRYATATAIAKAVPGLSTAAFVTNGFRFPDALSASSPAARDGTPILLTAADALPAATRTFLTENPRQTVYIVGGPGVVSAAVEAELDELAVDVIRLAGDGRFDTSRIIAERFFAGAKDAALVNADRFPDALAGGPHAARHHAPILLTSADAMPPQTSDLLGALHPRWVHVYGGPSAVSARAAEGARRAVVSAGAAHLLTLEPLAGTTINSVDGIELTFDRALQVNASSVFVTVAGQEVSGTITQGDFADTVVFAAGNIPFRPEAGRAYPVQVTVQVTHDGTAFRHVAYDLTYVKLDLGRGDSGASVTAVQNRLTDLGYWLGTADGNYGTLTVQAVMAFQKANGLERSGSLNRETRELLETAGRPKPRSGPGSGRLIEIDKPRQIMMFVNNGVVQWTFNTSTGTEKYYYHDGEKRLAHTPEGRFRISREIDGMREAELGKLWRPKYFTNAGHALHGSTSVPNYPASHGCARLTYPAIDFVWEAGLAPIGTPIWIY